MLNIESSLRGDKTQSLLKFALFCILATGLTVTFFYLTMDKTNKKQEITCIGDFMGDGMCDDSLNTKVCDYDSGDCCLSAIDKSNCIDCFCFAENLHRPEAKKSIQISKKLREI